MSKGNQREDKSTYIHRRGGNSKCFEEAPREESNKSTRHQQNGHSKTSPHHGRMAEMEPSNLEKGQVILHQSSSRCKRSKQCSSSTHLCGAILNLSDLSRPLFNTNSGILSILERSNVDLLLRTGCLPVSYNNTKGSNAVLVSPITKTEDRQSNGSGEPRTSGETNEVKDASIQLAQQSVKIVSVQRTNSQSNILSGEADKLKSKNMMVIANRCDDKIKGVLSNLKNKTTKNIRYSNHRDIKNADRIKKVWPNPNINNTMKLAKSRCGKMKRSEEDLPKFQASPSLKKIDKYLKKHGGSKSSIFYASKSKIHGVGLFASVDILEGTTIVEYVGEIIGNKVADRREKYYKEHNINSIYLFKIRDDLIIDATTRGNLARFINHSCFPNSASRMSDDRVFIYAIRAIKKDEEITLYYNFSEDDEHTRLICKCGHEYCTGYIV